MKTWFSYLKQGFSRKMPVDAVSASKEQPGDIRGNLKNVYPFVLRHWRKGSAAGGVDPGEYPAELSQPLIFRYMVDTVIMDRRLNLLAGVVLLMVAISGAAKLAGLWSSSTLPASSRE